MNLFEADDPDRFFRSSSSLQSVTSQLKEDDTTEDHFKSPAKAHWDDI